ncbi:Putative proteasome subunit alpha type-6 [Verticillium dahliae VDG1]|nr:Putative proteasome subunit alpha type-6 [Verticillium dahliae VDG1]
MPVLASARYGKDNVRVFKVQKDGPVQTVTEMTVCALLEGAIETSYTVADNSVVVATDSIKNTIYIKAKEHPVNPPELYASILGTHFLDTYAHISVANIRVTVHRWTRLDVDGKPHPHAFLRDGEETRTVEARVTRDGTWDRILSTDVDASWTWAFPDGLAAVEKDVARFDAAWEAARAITLKTFAEDESASVQNTMYKMCEQILDAAPETKTVSYALPNKHYFEIDLSWHKGLKNTGADAEVYAPQSGPNGLIKCEVARS